MVQQGHDGREDYYDERADGSSEHLREALARAFIDVPVGETTTETAIMDILMQCGLTEGDAANLSQ